MRSTRSSTSTCRLVLEYCTDKLMQVMDAENFVDEVYCEIMAKDGAPQRNSGVEVVSYSGRHSLKEPPTATRKMRARGPRHRLYMYEQHDIIVDWLEVKELYGTSAYARTACAER
eukprot:14640933-Heterocapsa_arctica.AAC.1